MIRFPLYALENGKCGCGDGECKIAGKHPPKGWSSIKEDEAPEINATQGAGILTGARSDCFVVDLDLKDGKDGLEELRKLGPVPATYAVATPTGGFHLYFKHPGFPVRNSGPKSNPLAVGIDIRGDGGYVVAPGSPHKNGGRYDVACDLPIVDAPAWLLAWPGLRTSDSLELAKPAEEAETAVAHIPREWRISRAKAWLATQAPAVEGQGGDGHTFQVLTRAVHDCYLTDASMINEAFLEWNARCSPPWKGKEWQHKIKSALENSTKPWSDTLGMEYRLEQAPSRLAQAAKAEPLVIPSAADSVTAGPFIFKIGGFNAPLPPLTYQIEKLICKGDVCMLVAHGNSLKTWLAFSLALAVANGRPWLGRFLALRGRAGIIDFESGEYEIKRRMKILGAKDEELETRLLYNSYSGAALTDTENWIALASLGLDLLIIDSFNAASPETDENDARAASMLQKAGAFANATGCTVIVIHHARKDNGGDKRLSVRGSSAIYAACDRVFVFDEPEKKDGGIVLTMMHSTKDGAGPTPPPVRVELSDGGLRYLEGEAHGEEKPIVDRNRETILRILKETPAGVLKSDLINMLEGTKAVRLACLSSASLSNMVREFPQMQGKSYVKYVMLNPGLQ